MQKVGNTILRLKKFYVKMNHSNFIQGNLVVLSASNIIGSVLCFFALKTEPPYCFILLYVGYFLVEMWFGVYLMGKGSKIVIDLKNSNVAFLS